MKVISLGFGIALAAGCICAAGAATTAPKIVKRYELGGEGGWDFLTLDAAARRLFVTRDEHVMVIDIDNGKLLGDIGGVNNAHGVALAPEFKRGFVSNGHSDSVTVFDLGTLKKIGEISVGGKDPDAIIFDPFTKHIFAFNGHSNNVSVIDPATDKEIATMPSPGRPESAVSDGKGHIFFNIEDKAEIAYADAKAAKVIHSWSLGTCEGPTGLAIDVAHLRLFSVCANKQMVVLDAADGHVVASMPIGDGPDMAAFDPVTATAYSANVDGTLTVIHQDDADHYSVVANIATPKRSRALALDEKSHNVYLPAATFGAAAAPTAAQPHPKGPMIAGSFGIIVVGTP